MRGWTASQDTWLARQIRSLVDPWRIEVWVLLLWAVSSSLLHGPFLGVLEGVVQGDPLARVDGFIYRALQDLLTMGDGVMIGITELITRHDGLDEFTG